MDDEVTLNISAWWWCESRQADFKLKAEWKTMNHPQCRHKAFSFDFPLPNSSAFQVITFWWRMKGCSSQKDRSPLTWHPLPSCAWVVIERSNPWGGDRKISFQREVQSSVHSGDIVSGPTDKPTCSFLEGLKPYFHSPYFWPEFEPHLCTESSVILKTCLLLVTKNTEMRDSPIPRRSSRLSVPHTGKPTFLSPGLFTLRVTRGLAEHFGPLPTCT